MASIFTKIIQGDIPSIKLYENEYAYAFMDIFPLRKGHALVVPKREVDKIYEMGDSELSELILVAKKIAKAMEKAIPCDRVGMSVIGLEVPHAHIHLVPICEANDINFAQPKLEMSKDEIQFIADKIISKLK